MKVKMTVAEALQFADEWTEGMTFHEGSQGWRVVCAVLAAEIRRLEKSTGIPEIIEKLKALRKPEGEDFKAGEISFNGAIDVVVDILEHFA